MAAPTLEALEERVAALEDKIKEMEQQETDKPTDAPRGWQRFVGAFQDDPGFEEAVRLGREWRESEPVLDDKGTP